MNKEDLRIRTWYGEAYYSGASELHVLVYDINDKELLESSCDEFNANKRSFGELDGKHSEVYGEVNVDGDDDELTFEEIIQNYIDADIDVFEEIYFKEKSDVYKALKKAHDFVNQFRIKKVYKNKATGEVLDISQYEETEEVVEK